MYFENLSFAMSKDSPTQVVFHFVFVVTEPRDPKLQTPDPKLILDAFDGSLDSFGFGIRVEIPCISEVLMVRIIDSGFILVQFCQKYNSSISLCLQALKNKLCFSNIESSPR